MKTSPWAGCDGKTADLLEDDAVCAIERGFFWLRDGQRYTFRAFLLAAAQHGGGGVTGSCACAVLHQGASFDSIRPPLSAVRKPGFLLYVFGFYLRL